VVLSTSPLAALERGRQKARQALQHATAGAPHDLTWIDLLLTLLAVLQLRLLLLLLLLLLRLLLLLLSILWQLTLGLPPSPSMRLPLRAPALIRRPAAPLLWLLVAAEALLRLQWGLGLLPALQALCCVRAPQPPEATLGRVAWGRGGPAPAPGQPPMPFALMLARWLALRRAAAGGAAPPGAHGAGAQPIWLCARVLATVVLFVPLLLLVLMLVRLLLLLHLLTIILPLLVPPPPLTPPRPCRQSRGILASGRS
jgi:hypothetical protein